MPKQDAERWNKRYQESSKYFSNIPRQLLKQFIHLLPQNGLALDVAMGTGANSALLANRGFTTIGIDISDIAVKFAHREYPLVNGVIGDMTQIRFRDHVFDLVLNFYYLDRNLFPQYLKWVKPGGFVVVETLLQMPGYNEGITSSNLLKPCDLIDSFHNWDILFYAEGCTISERGHHKAVASIVAKNNGGGGSC